MPSLYPSAALTVTMLVFSNRMSMASMNCNHAIMEDDSFTGIIVADVCLKDGADSMKLRCVNGEGILKQWTLNNDCDEEHSNVFETQLSTMGIDVVCDADPCQIAVFEVFDDVSDSGESSESEETTTEPTEETTTEPTEETTIEPTMEPSMEPSMEPTTEPTNAAEDMRRLQENLSGSQSGSQSGSHSGSRSDSHSGSHSDSSSAESSTCDFTSTPDIAAFIVDACVPTDEHESIMISCTGIHDAMVSFFANDEDHECSGTATETATVSEAFEDICGRMVACDVKAGDDYDTAPSVGVLAPLLITFALVVYAS